MTWLRPMSPSIYFAVYHPHLIDSTSPVAMALLWGVTATWWVGAIGGVVLALVNTLGPWPSVDWAGLIRRVALLMAIVWVSAMTILPSVYAFAGKIPVYERRPTFENDRRLVAVAVTHWFSYSCAVVVVLILAVWILLSRFNKSARKPALLP